MKLYLSKEEARKFCAETWFPKIRFVHDPNAEIFNKRLDDLMKIFTSEIEVSDYDNLNNIGTETSKGPEQVKKYFGYMLKTYPKMETTVLDLFPTEKGFILWYEGRNAGPAPYFQGMTIVELAKTDNDLKIKKLVEFYNILPFLP